MFHTWYGSIQESGSQKINIVGYSKGGLDARIFLDITDTKSTHFS